MISVLFTKIFKVRRYFDNIGKGILVLITYIMCTIIDILKCWLFEKIRYILKDTGWNKK